MYALLVIIQAWFSLIEMCVYGNLATQKDTNVTNMTEELLLPWMWLSGRMNHVTLLFQLQDMTRILLKPLF